MWQISAISQKDKPLLNRRQFSHRYESPIGASPSRNLDHSRPLEEEMFDRSVSYRGSVGRAIGAGNSYTGKNPHFLVSFQFSFQLFYFSTKSKTFKQFLKTPSNETNKLAINSYRSPKPGSGYKHSTLPTSIRNGYSSVSQICLGDIYIE
jgi:hypothetical protein